MSWTDPFEFDHGGQEEIEREIVLGHRWWTIDDIAARLPRNLLPGGLAGLLRRLASGDMPGTPITVE